MANYTSQVKNKDLLPIEYQRSLPVVRVTLWLLSAIFGLILVNQAFDLKILATTQTLPVAVMTLVISLVAYRLERTPVSGETLRYKLVGLLLVALATPVFFQNGYLPVTFAPISVVIFQCLCRGRGSKLLPYAVWAGWALAVYLSPIKEGQPFALHLMLITLILIPVTDILLRKANWETNTKDKLLSYVLAMGMLAVISLSIHKLVTGENAIPPLVLLAAFATSLWIISNRQLKQLGFRIAAAAFVLGTYWFSMSQNGVLPISLVAGFILFSFLLLPTFEALFVSLGLTALSLLPLLTLEASSLDFAPAPFFVRHFSVTLILIFALYKLFRVREQEVGYQPQPTPIIKGMLGATAVVGVLALIGYLTSSRAIKLELNAVLGGWLISGALVWLVVTWLSSVYLRNQQTLQQTVADLAISKETLEKQLDRQRHMFAVISHELRTPVAALSMLLHERAQNAPEDKDQNKSVELADHLVDVLNDLRQVAQPDQIKIAELKPTNLFQLIERATGSLTAILKERNQRLSLSTHGTLSHSMLLDRQHIRQIVTNLVKNASVHSGASEIWVDIHSDPANQLADVRIIVSDNGRGLDPSMQDRLFEAFARGNTDADGTGLGLFICQQLAQLMGGELKYQSRDGGGSCFALELSAQIPSEESLEIEQPKQLQDKVKGKRILLVEDNKTIQMITAKMLERSGATTTVADDGQSALKLYKSNPDAFDVILTDIMMPQMDGYELTLKLRALGCTLPIIGITAATIGEERERLLEHGATQVVAKPITMPALQAALQI